MEGWVEDWLHQRRAAGEKGLEVKKINNSFYVYRSTSHWNKETKRPDKRSVYLGKLGQLEGFVAGERKIAPSKLISVWQYGNALLLDQAISGLVPVLQQAFKDDWKEMYALAAVRASGYVPLKRAELAWSYLYDIRKLAPDMSAKHLSQMLHRVGLNRKGQTQVFQHLNQPGDELIYDLSCFFTQSEEVGLAEKGYNKEHAHLKQINLALLCGAEEHMPTMIRALPGSVRDVASLAATVEEIGLAGRTLILDRGFFGEGQLNLLEQKKIQYVQPARRNSPFYKLKIEKQEHFFYRSRLIKCGRRKRGERFLYLFEDVKLRAEEETNLYRQMDDKNVEPEHLEETRRGWGNILIISNLDLRPEDIFKLYKRRDVVEKLFDTYKNVLNADRTYLQDDAGIFGHVFTSFLSLHVYCDIERTIRRAGLEDRLSPLDVLMELGKVYRTETDAGEINMEIPKKVQLLEKQLHLNLFPKSLS